MLGREDAIDYLLRQNYWYEDGHFVRLENMAVREYGKEYPLNSKRRNEVDKITKLLAQCSCRTGLLHKDLVLPYDGSFSILDDASVDGQGMYQSLIRQLSKCRDLFEIVRYFDLFKDEWLGRVVFLRGLECIQYAYVFWDRSRHSELGVGKLLLWNMFKIAKAEKCSVFLGDVTHPQSGYKLALGADLIVTEEMEDAHIFGV